MDALSHHQSKMVNHPDTFSYGKVISSHDIEPFAKGSISILFGSSIPCYRVQDYGGLSQH